MLNLVCWAGRVPESTMKKRAIRKGSVDASELTPERRVPSSTVQVLEEVLRRDLVVFVIDAILG